MALRVTRVFQRSPTDMRLAWADHRLDSLFRGRIAQVVGGPSTMFTKTCKRPWELQKWQPILAQAASGTGLMSLSAVCELQGAS